VGPVCKLNRVQCGVDLDLMCPDKVLLKHFTITSLRASGLYSFKQVTGHFFGTGLMMVFLN